MQSVLSIFGLWRKDTLTVGANLGSGTTGIGSFIDKMNSTDIHLLGDYHIIAAGGHYGFPRNIRACSIVSPLVHKDILIDQDGVQWRVFTAYNKHIACREV